VAIVNPRIALIHAVRVSIDPIRAAFAEQWPEARTFNLLDDSLSVDLAAAGSENDAIQDRFHRLANYASDVGADAILFSCSAFGVSIDKVKARHKKPVLKPNEALIEEALEKGRRIAVLATFAPTLASMRPEFEALARELGKSIDLDMRFIANAMDALDKGDGARHDSLIAEAAEKVGDADAIVLAQFSMARAMPAIERAGRPPVLTSPRSAVAKLKRIFSN